MSNKDKLQIAPTVATQTLMHDLSQIIEQARSHVAGTANFALTMMYWHIGKRINPDVLGNQRAEYGKQIVSQLATQLQAGYGKKGFEERTIRRMMKFAQTFPDWKILSTLLILMSLKDDIKREFYVTMVAAERWSVRTLQLDKAGIKVAQYMTELPPRDVLMRQIQKPLETAHARFDNLITEEDD